MWDPGTDLIAAIGPVGQSDRSSTFTQDCTYIIHLLMPAQDGSRLHDLELESRSQMRRFYFQLLV